jgi:hypothetical protein
MTIKMLYKRYDELITVCKVFGIQMRDVTATIRLDQLVIYTELATNYLQRYVRHLFSAQLEKVAKGSDLARSDAGNILAAVILLTT